MARVFLAFSNSIIDPQNPNAMPCFYEAFIMELCEAGNNVFAIHHKKPFLNDWGKIPKQLLNEIEAFSPEVIFLFNNDFYDLSNYFDCPIVVFEVDSALFYSNQKRLRQTTSRYRFIAPQINSIQILTDRFGIESKNILYLPFFTSVKARSDLLASSNISFIGSKFSSYGPHFMNEFMQQKPTQLELLNYKRLLSAIIENPYATPVAIMQQLGIHSIGIAENFAHVNAIQLFAVLSDEKRITVLEQIADLGLSLYGTTNWITDICYCSDLLLSYKNTLTYSLQHNEQIYNSSKICININHVQAKSGFSWRVADIMASNACLVSEYCEDFKSIFPNVQIPLFTNKFEARELCVKLLQDESLRNDIVLQCQAAVEKNCRFHQTAEKMEHFLGVDFMSGTTIKMAGCKRIESLNRYEKHSVIKRILQGFHSIL